MLYPSPNDATPQNLWFKVAYNWYNWAVNFGITGLRPPRWDDTEAELIKKAAYYTARMADLP